MEQTGPFMQLRYLEKNHRVLVEGKWGIKSVFFSKQLQYVLGLATDRWVHIEEVPYLAKYPPDLSCGFNTLYVYCKLIEPQVVGSSLVPILRTVAIQGKHGDFIDKIFLAPHYLKLRVKSFDTIEIAVKNDSDETVRFNFGKVILKVHLRKVKA